MQAVEHGIDGGTGHFRGFAERDKGSRQGGSLFAGQPELLGTAADAQQCFGDFVFGCGGVVAEGVDGVTQLAHVAQGYLKNVGQFGHCIPGFIGGHTEGNAHLSGQLNKLRQVVKRNT